VAIRGMRKEIPSLEHFGKANIHKISVILIVKCGVSVVTDLLRAERNQLQTMKVGDLRLKLTTMEPPIKQICNPIKCRAPI